MKSFILEDGTKIKLSQHDMYEIASSYLMSLYREAAKEQIDTRSEYPKRYSKKRIHQVGEDVYEQIFNSELVYDTIETYLWDDVINKNDEDIKALAE